MSSFGGDAVDAIALAQDEARMLGRSIVGPEHLLLAILRRDRVRDLLSGRVRAGDVHAAIVERAGLGDELVLGRLPRSRRLDAVLAEAIGFASRRGAHHAANEHLLLALAGDEDVVLLLQQVGVEDVASLVDERFPPREQGVREDLVRAELVRAVLGEGQRPWRPAVPAFERFSGDARRAVRAAAESAAVLEHREVEPFHLLIGCVQAPESFASRVLRPIWEDGELGPVGELLDLGQDRTTAAMTRPHTQRLARTISRGLPGIDQGPDEHDLAWIQFDQLIRTLTLEFRRVLPPGWTVMGSARSDIHLRVPESQSESDFQIRPGWITAEAGEAPERLARVTYWMLERLQAAVMEAQDGAPWPTAADHEPAAVYAEIIPDRYNPKLRLGYGDPRAPTLPVTEMLVNMVTSTS